MAGAAGPLLCWGSRGVFPAHLRGEVGVFLRENRANCNPQGEALPVSTAKSSAKVSVIRTRRVLEGPLRIGGVQQY